MNGTLWCEQPVYVQLAFGIDRVKALADRHPEWKQEEPFHSILAGELSQIAASGEKGLLELIMVTHASMTTQEFDVAVKEWLKTARHPKLGRPYAELVYQPMLELLTYLRSKNFKTYIVTGGGVEFVRAFAERVYGVPPEQVIGSSIKIQFEMRDGKAVLVRLPQVDFIDDKEGKPVGIQNSSADARPRPLEIPTVTFRCCNGPQMVRDRASV
jgi:hypothetical protein